MGLQSSPEMEEERRDVKAHKAYCNMLDFAANAYFICKDYQYDGLHFGQPWVMGVQQEVERLKERVHERENLLRECQALKPQVRMLLMRVSELERVL
ncbi:hypothetical protein Bca52824_033263 [Brassica carinata]|uniref:Uncharacterized protein n=1 Tax=Brassica carinata TaxID=52824 RepID=A0A8X7SE02_BRACI|nr:hypothetical protein Bca52824_033263 [Brassica carinata]